IQTLQQLLVQKPLVTQVQITDWPAFKWRGYMVDAARNFMSLNLLKQQIDIMAAYKLNIFHFHITEDIAWRLESKKYPELTNPKNMLRNAGNYYSVADMQILIAYCKERFITLVPEIDMPGHSAAFERAMGVNMQTEKGSAICKNILEEICNTYDVPIIHIGGDEVKITNPNFLTDMASVIKSRGKTVVAWDPGGKLPKGTYLQMWNGNIKPKKDFPAIDSRNLYLNHLDPLDGVVSTFNHQICDTSYGSDNKIGATLCLWPDRRVANEEDMIRMNAVYPIMLSFAERCWQGGNNINPASLVLFENKLMSHKKSYFKNLPFPYVAHSNIEWQMMGPFKNNGITSTVFAPETASFLDTSKLQNTITLKGGTIWLKHFWHPMVKSHLQNPLDSTTWYATRKFWSNTDTVKNYWIGFNNISRSPATDSPPVGAWDNKGSSVWVNGAKIDPPVWVRGGQKGNSEIPLIDEGYEYRTPTKIKVHKGWNTVLIKAPVASTKNEWQNPVKWMFTFVETD
ncbi:MAG: family 20 glycosylhydrolase, partial [Bacteroidetes bacterium]|nr:family 20 glycosylhydrolase [Bacteroidota bacterium]